MKTYLTDVLLPYVTKKRNELKLPENHRALVIFDQFKGQVTASIFCLLEENNISFVLVPANCTDQLQPLDISVNKPAKIIVFTFKVSRVVLRPDLPAVNQEAGCCS